MESSLNMVKSALSKQSLIFYQECTILFSIWWYNSKIEGLGLKRLVIAPPYSKNASGMKWLHFRVAKTANLIEREGHIISDTIQNFLVYKRLYEMPIYLLTNKYIVCIFLSMQSMHIATADTQLWTLKLLFTSQTWT